MIDNSSPLQVRAANNSAKLLNKLVGGKQVIIVAHHTIEGTKRLVVHGRRALPNIVFSPELEQGKCAIYATLPVPNVSDFPIERVLINSRNQTIELIAPNRDSYTIALADEHVNWMLRAEMRGACEAWWDFWEVVVRATEIRNGVIHEPAR